MQHEPDPLAKTSGNLSSSQHSNILTESMDVLRAVFNALFRFLIKQSYLLSLLSMMVSLDHHF